MFDPLPLRGLSADEKCQTNTLKPKIFHNLGPKKQKHAPKFHSQLDRIFGGCSKCRVTVTEDYAFKRMFRDRDVAKDFLQQLLVGNAFPAGSKIKNLRAGPTEHIQDRKTSNAKRILFDVELETSSEIFLVEVQRKVPRTATSAFLQRIQFYSCFAYSHQIIKGTAKVGETSMRDYSAARRVISILILDSASMPLTEDQECVQIHKIQNTKTGGCILKSLTFVFIELSKFKLETDCQSPELLKEWLHFMASSDLSYPYRNEFVKRAANQMISIQNNEYTAYLSSLREKEASEAISLGWKEMHDELAKEHDELAKEHDELAKDLEEKDKDLKEKDKDLEEKEKEICALKIALANAKGAKRDE